MSNKDKIKSNGLTGGKGNLWKTLPLENYKNFFDFDKDKEDNAFLSEGENKKMETNNKKIEANNKKIGPDNKKNRG